MLNCPIFFSPPVRLVFVLLFCHAYLSLYPWWLDILASKIQLKLECSDAFYGQWYSWLHLFILPSYYDTRFKVIKAGSKAFSRSSWPSLRGPCCAAMGGHVGTKPSSLLFMLLYCCLRSWWLSWRQQPRPRKWCCALFPSAGGTWLFLSPAQVQAQVSGWLHNASPDPAAPEQALSLPHGWWHHCQQSRHRNFTRHHCHLHHKNTPVSSLLRA